MIFQLQCAVCQNQLTQPITLSCGFTICLSCFPSPEAFDQSMFVCPVKQCKEESHLFGPSLYLDTMISRLGELDTQTLSLNEQKKVEAMKTTLQCSMDQHLIQHPITNHCGHTFCRLCLLKYKISNDACNLCQKRLPSYQYLQKQPTNHILKSISAIIGTDTRFNNDFRNAIAKVSPISNNKVIQFTHTPHSNGSSVVYTNVPINILEFPVLPYQKLRIPVYTEDQRSSFFQSILVCEEYQCLCFGVMNKQGSNSAREGQIGTIVKILSVEQRSDSLVFNVQGLDRFQLIINHNEIDDLIYADIQLKLESQVDMISPMTAVYSDHKQHWVDHIESMNQQWKVIKEQQRQQEKSKTGPANDYLSPTSSPKEEDEATITTTQQALQTSLIPQQHQDMTRPMVPTSPPSDSFFSVEDPSVTPFSAAAIKLSSRIHDFISDLAYSAPTTSFCSAVDGLLGPVWLDSVQGLHGALPSAFHPLAMCWWSAIVLPVSNLERCHLLETDALEDRLNIILSWIQDLESQWVNCRRTALNTAAKVGQQQ